MTTIYKTHEKDQMLTRIKKVDGAITDRIIYINETLELCTVRYISEITDGRCIVEVGHGFIVLTPYDRDKCKKDTITFIKEKLADIIAKY